MNAGAQRLRQVIDAARADQRAALLVNLPANRGPDWLVEAARIAVEAGADMLEIQTRYPFEPDLAVDALRAIANASDIPCILWADLPTVRAFLITNMQRYRLGPACSDAGVAGIAVAAPTEFVQPFADSCGDDLAAINFISPGWPAEHFEQACRWGSGFCYAIGLETSPPTDPAVARKIAAFTDRARAASKRPVIVGAGVRTPEQAALAATAADGVAVAAAVKEALIRATVQGQDGLAALEGLVRMLRAAVTHPAAADGGPTAPAPAAPRHARLAASRPRSAAAGRRDHGDRA